MATDKSTIAGNLGTGLGMGGGKATRKKLASKVARMKELSENGSETDGFEKVGKPRKVASDEDSDTIDGEEEEEEEEEKSDLPVGSVSEVKNIYRSAKDRDGNFTWVRKYPEDVEEPAENAITDTYAVLVRNIKSPDGRKKLEAHSIVIQSPWLKKVLGEHVLKDYPGVACELDNLTFEAPFKPFVHRWTNLKDCVQRKDLDDKTSEHLIVLRDILQYEIGDSIKAYEDYLQKGVVTFKHLW